jgi:hypothetical protein
MENPCGINKRARVFLLQNCDVCSFLTPGTLGLLIEGFWVLFVVINVRPIYFWCSQFSTQSCTYEKKSESFNFRAIFFFSISWQKSPWTIINILQNRRNTKKEPNSIRHKHDETCNNISKTIIIFCTRTLFIFYTRRVNEM